MGHVKGALDEIFASILLKREKSCKPVLGPRGPHGIPSLVSPSVRPLVRKKNLDHIYIGSYAS